ncbi:hypothetical protein BDF22DRAFT_670027, partial [Syncephalis plumigaleata]
PPAQPPPMPPVQPPPMPPVQPPPMPPVQPPPMPPVQPPPMPPVQPPPVTYGLPDEGHACINVCRMGLICSTGVCTRVSPPPRSSLRPREGEACNGSCALGLLCYLGRCTRPLPSLPAPLPFLPSPPQLAPSLNSCTYFCPIGHVCVFGHCIPRNPYISNYDDRDHSDYYALPHDRGMAMDKILNAEPPDMVESSAIDDGYADHDSYDDNSDAYLWETEVPDINDSATSAMPLDSILDGSEITESDTSDDYDDYDDDDDIDRRRKLKNLSQQLA